jgi:hypothetical protein
MKRIISLSNSIVFGTVKEDIVSILPQLETAFRQRKNYLKTAFRQRKNFSEYYFDETEIVITLEQLDRLSADYSIRIGSDTITIEA